MSAQWCPARSCSGTSISSRQASYSPPAWAEGSWRCCQRVTRTPRRAPSSSATLRRLTLVSAMPAWRSIGSSRAGSDSERAGWPEQRPLESKSGSRATKLARGARPSWERACSARSRGAERAILDPGTTTALPGDARRGLRLEPHVINPDIALLLCPDDEPDQLIAAHGDLRVLLLFELVETHLVPPPITGEGQQRDVMVVAVTGARRLHRVHGDNPKRDAKARAILPAKRRPK